MNSSFNNNKLDTSDTNNKEDKSKINSKKTVKNVAIKSSNRPILKLVKKLKKKENKSLDKPLLSLDTIACLNKIDNLNEELICSYGNNKKRDKLKKEIRNTERKYKNNESEFY